MSRIFDNIETKFEEGLHAIQTNVGVERADFCVGHFNLRKATGGKVCVEDMAIRPKSIVPIIGEPDIDESYIRQQDPVSLHATV